MARLVHGDESQNEKETLQSTIAARQPNNANFNLNKCGTMNKDGHLDLVPESSKLVLRLNFFV